MASFKLYRYQLLPTAPFEADLVDGVETVDQLVAEKNRLFGEVIDEFKRLRIGRGEYSRAVRRLSEETFLLKMGPRRTVKIVDEDFTKRIENTYPEINIFVDNTPHRQLFAVSENKQAAPSTEILVEKLEKAFDRALGKRNLTISIERIYAVSDFWRLMREHNGEIAALRFTLVTPNMANISDKLAPELSEAAKALRSKKTKVEFDADHDANLEVTKASSIDSFVVYSAAGGGEAKIRLKGMKAWKTVGEETRSVEIKDVELDSPDTVRALIDAVLS